MNHLDTARLAGGVVAGVARLVRRGGVTRFTGLVARIARLLRRLLTRLVWRFRARIARIAGGRRMWLGAAVAE